MKMKMTRSLQFTLSWILLKGGGANIALHLYSMNAMIYTPKAKTTKTFSSQNEQIQAKKCPDPKLLSQQKYIHSKNIMPSRKSLFRKLTRKLRFLFHFLEPLKTSGGVAPIVHAKNRRQKFGRPLLRDEGQGCQFRAISAVKKEMSMK